MQVENNQQVLDDEFEIRELTMEEVEQVAGGLMLLRGE